MQGDPKQQRRVSVACEVIPQELDLKMLELAFKEAEEDCISARENLGDARDELDEAEARLKAAEAALSKAVKLASARDYVEADAAAISALPVI